MTLPKPSPTKPAPPTAGPLPRSGAGRSRVTGTIEVSKEGVVHARISLVDGTRPRILLGKVSRREGRRMARELSDRARAEGWVKVPIKPPPAPDAERFQGWFLRYLDHRLERGIKGTRQEQSRFQEHLLPVFGSRLVADITRKDLETFVAQLDTRVRAGEMSWRSAGHVWALLAHAMKEACGSKRLELRVREDNPAAGVRGPDRGRPKAKQFLYPSELLAILRCPRVPLRWKRLITLAVYTYTRPGELAALDWADVNEEHGVFHVHQALDDEGEAKDTKTGTVRLVPIEPALRPLLAVLAKEQGRQGRLVTMPPEEDLSERLRKYVGWAGVTRAALFVDPKHKTLKRLTWYDLRATGITWRAVRGDNPTKVHLAAGHEDLKTTLVYIRTAEASAPTFGEVFPALPGEVLSVALDSQEEDGSETLENGSKSWASPAGFEPALQP